jgi:peptidyl-prolyl cis-trans isomerase SurA
MKKYITACIFAILLSFSASAANKFEIIAIVDDHVISYLDVQNRINLAIATSGLPRNEETFEKIREQILKTLIDEAIYKKEAKRLGIEATPDDIANLIKNIELQNGLAAGKFYDFLKKSQISIDDTNKQLESQVLWSKIVNKQVRPGIIITEIEIDEKLEHIANSNGISELNVSEIVIPAVGPKEQKRVKILAEKLAKEIKNGSSFAAVAKSFSTSSNAASGGEIGWIRDEQLSKPLFSKIRNLQLGQISEPFFHDNNYYIFILNDRRALVKSDPANAKISFKQAFVAIAENSPRSIVDEKIKMVTSQANSYKSCKDFNKFAKAINSSISTDTISANINEISSEVRNDILATAVGHLSNIVVNTNGIFIFAVCDRTAKEESIVIKENVKQMLLRQKLDLQSQQYLKNLRQKSFIEIRG